MILLIDNYDSFVYNLGRHIGMLGRERMVVRNDAVTIADIAHMRPEAIILSPGPRGPDQAGICNDAIRAFHDRIPILGVCLGHQCIGATFGARVRRADAPVHGKSSLIRHDGAGLFAGLPQPLRVARYHSLIVDVPPDSPLRVTAQTGDGIVMAMQHTCHPVYGVQFHPESVLTDHGLAILRNFVDAADAWTAAHGRAA